MMSEQDWKTAALKFENEANQSYCEMLLLRGECIRLRRLNDVLSTFIENYKCNAGAGPPWEVRQAMDAVFPSDVSAVIEGQAGELTASLSDFRSAVAALWTVAKALDRGELRIEAK